MSSGLLLDQNLSLRLVPVLRPHFPGSVHVSEVGLASASDMAVWIYARENTLAIVSKDSDFHHLSFVEGSPPKVIWIRAGNCTTAHVAEHLLSNAVAIRLFLEDTVHSILTIDALPVSWPPPAR